MADSTIQFHAGEVATIRVLVDQDLAQWLCRQSALERETVGGFVRDILRGELRDHVKKVAPRR